MRPFTRLLLVVLWLSSPWLQGFAEAQQYLKYDGNWWLERDPDEAKRVRDFALKTLYLEGVLDGAMWLGPELMFEAQLEAKQSTEALLKAQREYTDVLKRLVVKPGFGAVFDGMTALYRDFRNRRIPVAYGVPIVLLQIAGTPQTEIDSRLEELRRRVAELGK